MPGAPAGGPFPIAHTSRHRGAQPRVKAGAAAELAREALRLGEHRGLLKRRWKTVLPTNSAEDPKSHGESVRSMTKLVHLDTAIVVDTFSRLDAETIADQSELLIRRSTEEERRARLLKDVAVAANAAASVEEALQAALDCVCAFTRWPVGHVYLPAVDVPQGNGTSVLISSRLWFLQNPDQFASFKKITE